MPTIKPNAVVINASQIPPARSLGFAAPARSSMVINAVIIPVTVPRNPKRGAIPATVANIDKPCSSLLISSLPAFSIASFTLSCPYLYFFKPFLTILAIGDFSSMQAETALLISFFLINPRNLTIKAGTFIFAFLKTKNRSITTLNPRTELANINHITTPPFKNISKKFIFISC